MPDSLRVRAEDLAAVHLPRSFDEREPDAEAAGGAIVGVLGLHEQLEEMLARQHLGAIPMPLSRTRTTTSSS